jgi:hypothetical protein
MSFDAEIDERRALLRPGGGRAPIFRARHLVHAQLIAVIPAVLVGIDERRGTHLIMEFMTIGVGEFVFAGLTMFAVFCPLMVLIRLATEFPPERRALWAVPLSIALTLVAMWALLPAVS